MLPNSAPLGIVAGGGRLPEILVSECAAAGRGCLVIALGGQGDPERFPNEITHKFRLGAVGHIIKTLRKAGVAELVFAGDVKRPSRSSLFPDWWAVRFLLKSKAYSLGDDGLLRAIVTALEEGEGFRVVGADEVVPDLLAPAGLIAGPAPSGDAMALVEFGVAQARDLGRRDAGQAVIAGPGGFLAEEGPKGTEALVAATGRAGAGGVLVKAKKPGQERRVDLPAIGPDTIDQAAAAGLNGVAVEAGDSLLIDRDEVRQKAEALGIFVYGFDGAGGEA